MDTAPTRQTTTIHIRPLTRKSTKQDVVDALTSLRFILQNPHLDFDPPDALEQVSQNLLNTGWISPDHINHQEAQDNINNITEIIDRLSQQIEIELAAKVQYSPKTDQPLHPQLTPTRELLIRHRQLLTQTNLVLPGIEAALTQISHNPGLAKIIISDPGVQSRIHQAIIIQTSLTTPFDYNQFVLNFTNQLVTSEVYFHAVAKAASLKFYTHTPTSDTSTSTPDIAQDFSTHLSSFTSEPLTDSFHPDYHLLTPEQQLRYTLIHIQGYSHQDAFKHATKDPQSLGKILPPHLLATLQASQQPQVQETLQNQSPLNQIVQTLEDQKIEPEAAGSIGASLDLANQIVKGASAQSLITQNTQLIQPLQQQLGTSHQLEAYLTQLYQSKFSDPQALRAQVDQTLARINQGIVNKYSTQTLEQIALHPLNIIIPPGTNPDSLPPLLHQQHQLPPEIADPFHPLIQSYQLTTAAALNTVVGDNTLYTPNLHSSQLNTSVITARIDEQVGVASRFFPHHSPATAVFAHSLTTYSQHPSFQTYTPTYQIPDHVSLVWKLSTQEAHNPSSTIPVLSPQEIASHQATLSSLPPSSASPLIQQAVNYGTSRLARPLFNQLAKSAIAKVALSKGASLAATALGASTGGVGAAAVFIINNKDKIISFANKAVKAVRNGIVYIALANVIHAIANFYNTYIKPFVKAYHVGAKAVGFAKDAISFGKNILDGGWNLAKSGVNWAGGVLDSVSSLLPGASARFAGTVVTTSVVGVSASSLLLTGFYTVALIAPPPPPLPVGSSYYLSLSKTANPTTTTSPPSTITYSATLTPANRATIVSIDSAQDTYQVVSGSNPEPIPDHQVTFTPDGDTGSWIASFTTTLNNPSQYQNSYIINTLVVTATISSPEDGQTTDSVSVVAFVKIGEPPSMAGNCWPSSGVIKQEPNSEHATLNGSGEAIDIAGPAGTPVYASHDGNLRSSQQGDPNNVCGDKRYGTCIFISSAPYSTLYAHLLEVVAPDGPVTAGTLIGTQGNTGSRYFDPDTKKWVFSSSGTHLHYESVGVPINSLVPPYKKGDTVQATCQQLAQ